MSLTDRKEKEEGLEATAYEVLHHIRDRLEEVGIPDSSAESWMILEWICGINRETYFFDPKTPVSAETMKKVEEMLAKRRQHVPLQYLMGSAPFMGYTFYVNEHVLIPRQDTECLVSRCLEILKGFPTDQGLQILDLCTGSGCIGISLKKSFPDARVVLSDISEEALAVAKKNARELDADVDICQGDLFEGISGICYNQGNPFEGVPGRYHMIVSNPPYIPTAGIKDLMPEVRDHEPGRALDGGLDGLMFYRRIIREAKHYLEPGGYLLFEIGMDQGPALKDLLATEGYEDIVIRKDLAGLDRIAEGRR